MDGSRNKIADLPARGAGRFLVTLALLFFAPLLAACDDDGSSGTIPDAKASDAGVDPDGRADGAAGDGGASDANTRDAALTDATVETGDAMLSADAGQSGLDPSGETVPGSYPVPTSNVVFLATNGLDTNPGTEVAPFKSLTQALDSVPSGGTIVVRGGVYRDAHLPIVNNHFSTVSKTFTLQSYPGEQVWFDGTDVVSGWTSDGSGRWYVSWDTPEYCHHYQSYPTGGYYSQVWPWEGTPGSDGPCIHADMALDPDSDPDPQMVFIDGIEQEQVRALGEVTSTSFYHDVSGRRIYIGTDPGGRSVEITRRPMAFALEGGAGGNIIRGVGFRRYATNEKVEGSYTAGVLLINAPNVVLEHVVFSRNAGGGITYARSTGAVIDRCVFANNGYNGLLANGSAHHGGVDQLTLVGSIFNGNNQGRFGQGCSASCGHAGVKLAHMAGYTLRNNLFENQVGSAHGFWCDLMCVDGIHVNNVFRNNGGNGLFYEVSEGGIIASNLSYGNGRYGLKVSASDTRIYNNTLVANGQGGALIYDDDRSPGVGGWDDVGPDSADVELVNNVFVDNSGPQVRSWRTSDTSPNTGPNTFYSSYDYNSCFRDGTTHPLAEWKDPVGSTISYSTLADFAAAHPPWEAHGQSVTDGSDPFLDLASGDYQIQPGAVSPGFPIPADIASLIGVSAGTTARGALLWWPNGGT